MADLQAGDKFIVNRGDTVQKTEAVELMATIQDSDWLLVNRADAVKKISGADVKNSFGKSPIYPESDEITSTPGFEGGTGTEADPFILKTIDVRPGGATGFSVEELRIAVAGGTEGQPVNWTDNSTGAGNRFTQPSGITGPDGAWVGRLLYTDVPATTSDIDYVGKLQIGDVHIQWTVHQGIDPVRPIDPAPDEVTAVPDFVSGNGTQADPYVLNPILVAPKGNSGQSVQVITIAEDGASAGELVRWIDNSIGAGDRFAQPETLTDADGKWVGHLLYQDTPPTDDDEIYTGDLQIGEVHFRWQVTQLPSTDVRPDPDDITASPNFQSGSGTVDDPYVLESIEVKPAGASGVSVETLTITAKSGVEGLPVLWSVNSGGDRFAQPSGLTGPGGVWSGKLIYTDTPESGSDQTYVGVLQVGEVYFSWTVEQIASATIPPVLTNVSLVESNPDADPRFTDQSFVASSSLSEEGTP
ncbi:MAG: hypothetical protein CL859_03800, partial [Cyanobium sp. ARS6]|nr:hypothetical protein [Cyanobium sp. ARS6]